MVCGRKCEIYSRIVGYYRPVHNWNKGKQEEFRNRIPFKNGFGKEVINTSLINLVKH